MKTTLNKMLDDDYQMIMAPMQAAAAQGNTNYVYALPDNLIYSGKVPGAHDDKVVVHRKNTSSNYRNTKDANWPELDISKELQIGYVYYTVRGLGGGIWDFILVRESAGQRWLTPRLNDTYQRAPVAMDDLWIDEFETTATAVAEVSTSVEYGAKCGECGEHYEYAVRVPNFRCTGCKLRATMF